MFCVNWGHAAPVARHIVCVYDKHDRVFADAHFATFGEAIAYVDKLREAFAPVDRIYSDWETVEIPASTQQSGTNARRTEVLWMNFTPSAERLPFEQAT